MHFHIYSPMPDLETGVVVIYRLVSEPLQHAVIDSRATANRYARDYDFSDTRAMVRQCKSGFCLAKLVNQVEVLGEERQEGAVP
jgi:hypothetical protein